jgi:hypothetical protein
VVLALALAALVLSSCGGGSSDAQTLLSETFRSAKPVDSGRLDLSLSLAAATQGSPAKPLLGLHVAGPFQGLGGTKLPRFALQLTIAAGGHALSAGAISTSDSLYISIAGTQFQAPAETVSQLERSYTQATRSASSAQSRSTFAGLGIDPGAWITDPRILAPEGGIAHVSGRLDTSRFLADAQKLSGASGALGLGAGGVGAAVPSSGQLGALAQSVSGARVDVYTGSDDHVLRRLLLRAQLKPTALTRATFGAATAATLTLDLRLAAVNEPQTIAAPAHPQPLSALLPALERLGVGLAAG